MEFHRRYQTEFCATSHWPFRQLALDLLFAATLYGRRKILLLNDRTCELHSMIVEMQNCPKPFSSLRDGPLEKWWVGWGKNQKKIHARENVRKTNSCKGKCPEKKFMHKMGLIFIWNPNSFCQSAQVVSPVFKKLEIFWGSARML